MDKTKWYISVIIVFCLTVSFFVIVSIKSVKAQTTSTTFPVDEAGIAAYVKLDSVDITDLTEALNFFEGDKKQGPTYVIGQMKIENEMGQRVPFYNYPRLYIGLDGWMIAYYLKDEEASRIIQWKGYAPGVINTTTLKDAIDTMCANIGVRYSTEVKYYDFEFPNANKMTVIAETAWSRPGDIHSPNSFSLTIPGTIHEASYSVYYGGQYYHWRVKLAVDGTTVFWDGCDCQRQELKYGYYEPTLLGVNIPHLITIEARPDRAGAYINAATVLIYQTD